MSGKPESRQALATILLFEHAMGSLVSSLRTVKTTIKLKLTALEVNRTPLNSLVFRLVILTKELLAF